MNAVSELLTPPSTVLAGGNSLDKTKPGLVAFLIILVMGLALWALLKNMGKQLGRAKEHFEAEDAALAAAGAEVAKADAAKAGVAKATMAESAAETPKQDGAGVKDAKKDAAAE